MGYTFESEFEVDVTVEFTVELRLLDRPDMSFVFSCSWVLGAVLAWAGDDPEQKPIKLAKRNFQKIRSVFSKIGKTTGYTASDTF